MTLPTGWRYLKDLPPEQAGAIRARCEKAARQINRAARGTQYANRPIIPCTHSGHACATCVKISGTPEQDPRR